MSGKIMKYVWKSGKKVILHKNIIKHKNKDPLSDTTLFAYFWYIVKCRMDLENLSKHVCYES